MFSQEDGRQYSEWLSKLVSLLHPQSSQPMNRYYLIFKFIDFFQKLISIYSKLGQNPRNNRELSKYESNDSFSEIFCNVFSLTIFLGKIRRKFLFCIRLLMNVFFGFFYLFLFLFFLNLVLCTIFLLNNISLFWNLYFYLTFLHIFLKAITLTLYFQFRVNC